MSDSTVTQVPILFIADDSLTNPILRSQGFPLLGAMAKLGHQCSIISFEDRNAQAAKKEVFEHVRGDLAPWMTVYGVGIPHPIVVPRWLMIYLKGLFVAIPIVLRSRITIVHARSFVPAMIGISLKYLLRERVRLLYDNRGVFVDEEIYGGRWRINSVKVRLARRIEHCLVTNTDAIVVVSEAFRRHLQVAFSGARLNLDAKVTVISNRTHLNPSTATSASLLRPTSDTITAVYSGSAAPWQCIPDLVVLFRTGYEHFSNLAFRILTYERREAFLVHFKDDLGLKSRVRIDRLNPQEVAAELAKAHFGILLREPHLVNRVACPLKFSEYLACGLPVMLSEGIGDTEEIVRHHRVGVVVRDRNYRAALTEMIDLLREPSVHARCVEAAAREFDIEDAIAAYRTVYGIIVQ